MLAYQIDRRRWVECSCNNGRPGLLMQRSQSGGLPFHWATVVPEQTAAELAREQQWIDH